MRIRVIDCEELRYYRPHKYHDSLSLAIKMEKGNIIPVVWPGSQDERS